MKIIMVHFQFLFLQTLRQPSYVVSTLIFPALFFLIFAHPNINSPESANMLMGSFSCFAILGVMFLQFGVNLSHERASQWSSYVATLPISNIQLYLARSLNALLFALLSAIVVIATVNITSTPNVSTLGYFEFLWVLLVGAVPFALMGILLGLTIKPQSALPIANLIYLLMSFAGGLWMPPNILPEKIANLSLYLPTRFYGEMVWASLLDKNLESKFVNGMLLSTLGLVALLYFVTHFSTLRRLRSVRQG